MTPEHVDEFKQLQKMRVISVIEGSTLLLLLGVAVPLKHIFGIPTATAIVGPIHGIAFALYIWALVQTVSAGEWTGGEIARMVLAAFIPLGTFLNERALARRQKDLAAVW